MNNIYNVSSKIKYNDDIYIVKATVVYLGINYILCSKSESFFDLIVLKSDNNIFSEITPDDNADLYARLMVLFIGLE